MTWHGRAWRCNLDIPRLESVRDCANASVTTVDRIDVYEFSDLDGPRIVTVQMQYLPSTKVDYNTLVAVAGNSLRAIYQEKQALEFLLKLTLSSGTPRQRRFAEEFAGLAHGAYINSMIEALLKPGTHH